MNDSCALGLHASNFYQDRLSRRERQHELVVGDENKIADTKGYHVGMKALKLDHENPGD